MAKTKDTVFGIAMRNFTKYPEMPSARGLIDYGVRMEELGYESIWAWDHILLGVDPNFPIHEALTILTAVAARTSKIKVGTGILVMPMRNPVLLAKELATIDQISERTAHRRRGGRAGTSASSTRWAPTSISAARSWSSRLEVLTRLWTEDRSTATIPPTS